MLEAKRYPAPEIQKGGSFYTAIPLIEGFEQVVGSVRSNEEFKARLNAYAVRTTEALGLTLHHLGIDERGMTTVGVSPGECACLGITGKSWEQRDRQLPEFSTHNVDTPEQYVALTSIVFSYLNRLQGLLNQSEK